MTALGSHFGTLGAPRTPLFGQKWMTDFGVLLFLLFNVSAVPLWAPKEAKRVPPRGLPKDPKSPPKVAQGSQKTVQRPQNPPTLSCVLEHVKMGGRFTSPYPPPTEPISSESQKKHSKIRRSRSKTRKVTTFWGVILGIPGKSVRERTYLHRTCKH